MTNLLMEREAVYVKIYVPCSTLLTTIYDTEVTLLSYMQDVLGVG